MELSDGGISEARALSSEEQSAVINLGTMRGSEQQDGHGGGASETLDDMQHLSVSQNNIAPQNSVTSLKTYQKAHKLDLASLRPKECTLEMSEIDFRA